MEVQPKKPSAKGPAEWFTGDVYINPITQGQPPSRLSINAVHFTAHTAWHPQQRTDLYVTEGEGLVQSRGEHIVPIHAGRVVRTPADGGTHSATPDHFMPTSPSPKAPPNRATHQRRRVPQRDILWRFWPPG